MISLALRFPKGHFFAFDEIAFFTCTALLLLEIDQPKTGIHFPKAKNLSIALHKELITLENIILLFQTNPSPSTYNLGAPTSNPDFTKPGMPKLGEAGTGMILFLGPHPRNAHRKSKY